MIGKTPVRDLLSTSIDHLDAEVLLAHVLKKDRMWLRAHLDEPVATKDLARYQSLVTRRKKQEPVAYLIGKKDFYGRSFIVTKHTLIPRPDTELLVERALAAQGDVYWDVGTGSGAIAVTLACEQPRAAMLATDVSARALTVAKKNARAHGAPVTFLKSNLLQPPAYRWLKKHRSDHLVIAANLPYLPIADKKILAKDVTAYEPSSALFSGADGLALIRRFLGQLARHIPEWGYARVTLFLEFDPPQVKTLRAILKKIFPQSAVVIHQDLAGRNRVAELSMTRA
ncbi:MAG: hypothetical protein RL141_697 [Candidatus Parcubacteria bacterium]|jgi:release factor glutamine methyltransferase